MTEPFVPEDFVPPAGLATSDFKLEPLGPQHNERDHAAWMSSIEHIGATAGFKDTDWPRPMSLEENLRDLEGHAKDFVARTGFTYTVLDPVDDDVIGCVYLYPDREGTHDVRASSWVRSTHASLDEPLYRVVLAWLGRDWPFSSIGYGSRDEPMHREPD